MPQTRFTERKHSRNALPKDGTSVGPCSINDPGMPSRCICAWQAANCAADFGHLRRGSLCRQPNKSTYPSFYLILQNQMLLQFSENLQNTLTSTNYLASPEIPALFSNVLCYNNFLFFSTNDVIEVRSGKVLLEFRRKMFELVDLEKCCKSSLWLRKSALIQPRTDLPKFR